MTIITHDIIAVCLTVIRNNSGISNKIFSVCENRSLKINWHIAPSAGAKKSPVYWAAQKGSTDLRSPGPRRKDPQISGLLGRAERIHRSPVSWATQKESPDLRSPGPRRKNPHISGLLGRAERIPRSPVSWAVQKGSSDLRSTGPCRKDPQISGLLEPKHPCIRGLP